MKKLRNCLTEFIVTTKSMSYENYSEPIMSHLLSPLKLWALI